MAPLFRAAAEQWRTLRNATVESPQVPITSATLLELFGGAPTQSGVSVTEHSALGMAAVWRAVNLIASTSAALPLHAYRAGETVRVRMPAASSAAKLLDNPHPDLTRMELLEIVFCHVLLWGNAYLRILRNGLDRPAELWPLHPSRVRAGRASETGAKVYAIDGGQPGGGQDLTDREVLHIPGFGYDGVCGVSPIRAARQGLGLAMAAEQYGAALFGSGSLATGILQTEQRLEQRDANALKERWKAKAAGLAHAHDVVVLDRGAKFQQLSIPPEDAQFIESRKFQIEEVARLFGVPPHMLGQTEKSTSWGTGIEQQSIGFVQYTLAPWLKRVEERISRILRPEAAYCRFTVEGLLRGDSAQRSAFYRELWGVGVLSTNDIRALEDMEPVDGGDARYVPLNMGQLGAAAPEGAEVPTDA